MVSSINNLVWVKGTLTSPGVDDDRWLAKGVYTTEGAAVAACGSDDDFIVLVELDKPFPAFAIDAIKMYYPCLETWETSVLYKMRYVQHQPPKKCSTPQLRLIKSDAHD